MKGHTPKRHAERSAAPTQGLRVLGTCASGNLDRRSRWASFRGPSFSGQLALEEGSLRSRATSSWILTALLATWVAAVPAAAQAPATSPVLPRPTLNLDPVGEIGLALLMAWAADEGVRNFMQASRSDESDALARVGKVFGNTRHVLPVLGAGYLAGQVLDEPGLSRATLRAGEAFLIGGAAAAVLKTVTGRPRPGVSGDPVSFQPFGGHESFPSGHATVAFAVATALAHETPDRLTDVGLYAAASLTALGRMNDDRHWFSDVVAGAVLGNLVGRWVTSAEAPLRLQASPRSVEVTLQF